MAPTSEITEGLEGVVASVWHGGLTAPAQSLALPRPGRVPR